MVRVRAEIGLFKVRIRVGVGEVPGVSNIRPGPQNWPTTMSEVACQYLDSASRTSPKYEKNK